MKVRPHPTRPGWYQVDIGYGKNRERLAHPGDFDAACEYGRLRMAEKRPATSTCFDRVSVLLEKYLASYKIDHAPAGYQRQTRCCSFLQSFFGHRLLQNITTQDVEAYKQARIAAGVKPVTVQKELCALSGFFKWAEDLQIINEPPCRVKKFRSKMIAPPKMEIPSRDELQRVIAEIKPELRGLFALMLNYGLRTSEAFTLNVKSYNIERQILGVTGKGNVTRYIPIVDEPTHLELKSRTENATHDFLWYSVRSKGAFTDLRGALTSAAKRAGVGAHIHNHLLRHGCFTDLIEVADIQTVKSLAGHSSINTTQKYLHVRQERMKDAMKRHHNV